MLGLFAVLRRFAMFGLFAVLSRFTVLRAGGRVSMKLFRAIRAFKFMTFASNDTEGYSHKKDGEKFHCAASIATHRGKATPKRSETEPFFIFLQNSDPLSKLAK